MSKEFEVVKFVDNDFELAVKVDMDNDTVWLSQKEMTSLFNVSADNISLHINNILKEKELDPSTTEESSVVQIEGTRSIKCISIYRRKSRSSTLFLS